MSNKNFQLNKGHRQFDVSKKKRTFDLEKDPEFVDEVIKDSDATVIPVVPVVQNDVQPVKAAQTPAKSSDATAPTSGAKAAQTSAKPSDEKVQPAKKIKNFLLAGLAIAATVLLFVFLFTGNDVESEQPGTNLISEQNGGGTNDPAVSGTNDPAVSGTNDPVVSGTNDPAVSGTNDPAVSGTNDPAVSGTNDPAVSGTSDPVVSGTNGSAVSGTNEPAVSGTNGSVVSGTNDSGAVKPGNATLSDAYIEEKAKLVIRGDFGNGAERKRRLGAEYKAIQKKVNEMYAKGLVY